MRFRVCVSLLALVFALILCGCSKRAEAPAPPSKAVSSGSGAAASEPAPDLLPLEVGNRWELTGKPGERLVWEVVAPAAANKTGAAK